MKKTLVSIIFACGLAACGGGSETRYAGLDLAMPPELDVLNADHLRVSGSVWSLDAQGSPLEEISPSRDSLLTIRGQYALPMKNVKKGNEYEYRLAIYYQADAYLAPSVTSRAVEISTDFSLCPSLSLSPDSSLSTDEDGAQWLLLCEAALLSVYDPDVAIDVAAENIVCDGIDADGDGSSNLTELSLTYDPYNGDYDGDCVADGSDAFPANPDEWLDTDGDGIGNNADTDKDADGLSNSEEESIGTDPLDPDSDDDTILDGSDNCPLNGSSADQTDTDGDGIGNLCDTDADNDGLSDSDEAARGTNPHSADTDNDGDNDGAEVSAGTNPLDPDSDNDGVQDGPDVFPLDPTETTDTDSDGVGDNADLCDNTADPENSDTDGDGIGNICDDDDDGDGVPDQQEGKTAGLNSLNRDSDNDGLIDNWGNVYPATLAAGESADLCPTIAKTADNEVAHDTDNDGDDFGDLCDLSDDPAVDLSADEIHFSAVFVDSVNGDDSNDGSINNPVKTLDRAGALASADGKAVYATGDFTLEETWQFPDAVTAYGGFAPDFSTRDPVSDPSVVSSSGTAILVNAENRADGTGLDGFTLVNDTVGGNIWGLFVSGGSLRLANSTIMLGNGDHVFGLTAESAEIDLDHVTWTLADSGLADPANSAYGLYLDQSDGNLTDSTMTLADYAQRFAVYCTGEGSADFILTNVTLDVLEGAESASANLVYVTDCNGTYYDSNDAVQPALGGFDITGLTVDGLF